jgi:hypothetical protein
MEALFSGVDNSNLIKFEDGIVLLRGWTLNTIGRKAHTELGEIAGLQGVVADGGCMTVTKKYLGVDCLNPLKINADMSTMEFVGALMHAFGHDVTVGILGKESKIISKLTTCTDPALNFLRFSNGYLIFQNENQPIFIGDKDHWTAVDIKCVAGTSLTIKDVAIDWRMSVDQLLSTLRTVNPGVRSHIFQ